MPFAITPSFDSQGNILALSGEMRVLGLSGEMKKPVLQSTHTQQKGMKKSPSAVFSWPMFVTNSSSEAVMVPIRNLVQSRATDTVRSVLWSMIKNKVDCMPVYNEATKKYVGFVDMFELVLFIAKAAGPAVTRSDFFQQFKRASFGDAQVSKITSAAPKDHSASVADVAPLSAMFDLIVSANLSHVPVMSKQKVLGLVSQSRIVQYLAQNKGSFSQLASKQISQLDIAGTDNAYTIEEDTQCVSAFVYMAEKGVRGVAVVNKDGQYVDAVNSFDIKGLVHGDFFSDLRQPILRYLSKSRILLGKNMSSVVCTGKETLGELLDKMAQEKIYRVFVLDENRKPVSMICLRDILKAMHAYVPTPVTPVLDGRSFLAGSGGC